MPPAGCAPPQTIFQAVFVGVLVLAGAARAQHADVPGSLSEMPLPGGLRGALAAIDDRVAADRSQFLAEFIRRSYQTPLEIRNVRRDTVLRELIAHLDASSRLGRAASPETLPLPLPAPIWIKVVFGGRPPSQNLVSAILESRGAALLYYGLLSLDDPTRAWLATERDLIADLASHRSGAFVFAAPGLRVTGGLVRVPGGGLAQPAWEAIVGRRANEPADFVRALLAQQEGRLAYFFGAISQLTPAQVRLALNLDSPDVAGRVAAARRLQAVFERLASGWQIEQRPFWRPALDPALLVAQLRLDENGRLALPGTRRFWNAVFADSDQNGGQPRNKRRDDARALAEGDPVDFPWLCEQVFTSDKAEHRRRYQLVLFASRTVPRIGPDTAGDAVDTIRAADMYPALVAVLERAKLADVAAFAAAVRRAAQLSAIKDGASAVRALAQFQGGLALLTRAVSRRTLPADALSSLVSSLSAVELNDRGDYDGRLVRWLVSWTDVHVREAPKLADLNESAAGPLEESLLRMLAGPRVDQPRIVDWEGTRYRLDLARGEAARLARFLGEPPRPFLSSARTLVGMSNVLGDPALTRERLRAEASLLEEVAKSLGWTDSEGDAPRPYRDVAAGLRRAQVEDVRAAARLAPVLRTLADDLLARGLMELTYAVAMGQPDRASISADDAAGRHDFGLRVSGERRTAPWQFPIAGADAARPWHVTGSVLGLDVRLSEFALVRLSSRPPSRKPTLSDDFRRVVIETVALIEPALLTETDRDTIVAAIRKGRARLAAVRTPVDAVALADEIRVSPARRTLLAWMVEHEPTRVTGFLSPSELLWLGLEKMPIAASLHAWGAPGEPRLGCLCLQLLDPGPWEILAGRWHSGIFASGFPDLNLRLAELLADLQMPAQLLGPVLASATLDLVNTATSRDLDDRRGLVEFVQALRPERVEQYLALLTTDGPLVPVETGGPR